MAAYTAFPFPFYLPYVSLRAIEAFFKSMAKTYHVRPEHKWKLAQHKVTPTKLQLFKMLTRDVRPTPVVGEYFGPKATLSRTKKFSLMSGDRNAVHLKKPNPRFGGLIMHGADIVAQAVVALMHHERDSGLILVELDIQFRDAVVLGKDTLFIRITNGENTLERQVDVFAYHDGGMRLVTRTLVTLKEGVFEEGELEHHLLSASHISAMLARLHRGCLYYQQKLTLHKGVRPSTVRTVSVQGRRREDGDKITKIHIDTVAYSGSQFSQPRTTGQAIIIPK